MFASLNAACLSAFGSDVSYWERPITGARITVRAIVSRGQQLGPDTPPQVAELFSTSGEFTEGPAAGDQAEIDGETYRVVDVRYDVGGDSGSDGVRLTLERYRG